MSAHPVSDEVGACLGYFFNGGSGPSHGKLTSIFQQTGFGDVAPYDLETHQPNKEDRVRRTVACAVKRPARSADLVRALLAELRACGCFDTKGSETWESCINACRRAFVTIGWELTKDGQLYPSGLIVTGLTGRPAIEEQLARLHRATDDPALMLGTAKEMLESTAKYVLDKFGYEFDKTEFSPLWHHARERLSLLPTQVDVSTPAGKARRTILQSAWQIAEQVNTIRCSDGTGHGHTLPTGVTPEDARFVVREASSVVELVLATLDRQFGST